MLTVKFTIPGRPVPKKVMTYKMAKIPEYRTNAIQRTLDYQNKVKTYFLKQVPSDLQEILRKADYLGLECDIYLNYDKKDLSLPRKRGDGKNYFAGIEDALQKVLGNDIKNIYGCWQLFPTLNNERVEVAIIPYTKEKLQNSLRRDLIEEIQTFSNDILQEAIDKECFSLTELNYQSIEDIYRIYRKCFKIERRNKKNEEIKNNKDNKSNKK